MNEGSNSDSELKYLKSKIYRFKLNSTRASVNGYFQNALADSCRAFRDLPWSKDHNFNSIGLVNTVGQQRYLWDTNHVRNRCDAVADEYDEIYLCLPGLAREINRILQISCTCCCKETNQVFAASRFHGNEPGLRPVKFPWKRTRSLTAPFPHQSRYSMLHLQTCSCSMLNG